MRPSLRPFGRGVLVAQTASEAAGFDAHAIEDVGVPQRVLMENAGRAVAAVLRRIHGHVPVIGLVGSGNNGGDALVALRVLAGWGHDVRAILVADRDPDDPLLHGWPVELVSSERLGDDAWDALLSRAGAIVDGILGTGVEGAPRPRQAGVIERIADRAMPVVAVDVPSGIDATTGAVPGVAVRATTTVSFGAPKTGALLHPARAFVGRHVAVEIGFPPLRDRDARATVVTPGWARARLPARSTDTHKNAVGRVLVVGGAPGMAGAVVLAARAAFAAGAGLVRVATASGNREIIQAAVPEAMHVDFEDDAALEAALEASDAVAVGPGLGTDAVAASVWSRVAEAGAAPLVVDADALNLVAAGAAPLDQVSKARPVLITPHPGEMSRLMSGAPEAAPDGGVLAIARAAAARFRCAVLLKGAPSVVADRDGLVRIDTQGSSDLAVAGMGDTLTGVCAALLAQGLEPGGAASVGLYLSGRAGRLAGRGVGLIPSDIVRWLPEALVEPDAARSDLDLPFVVFDADPAR